MGIRSGIVLLLIMSVLLVYLSPRTTMEGGGAGLLYAEPFMMRAASNISHTLFGDLLWLMASDVGESAGSDVSAEESVAIARGIAVMDPFFFPAVHYHATYLAAIKGAVREGAELYATVGWFVRDDFQLYFNEMILRLTYETPLDNERIVALAKKIMRLPDTPHHLGNAEYRELVEGMMHYAASREEREAKKREDLMWLLERSGNATRREEIVRELGPRG